MFGRFFPNFNLKNIWIYYLLGIFLNGWFILPNWVFFFNQYISMAQIGIVEGVAILTGILMEVPSGALADLLGKKRTILFGSLLLITACLVLINSTKFLHFLIGNTVMFIGFAFQSGATEAFAFDSMKEKNLAEKYDTVAGKYASLSIIATVFSTFLGGFLYKISPTTPFIAWIVFLIISVFLILMATEPKIDTEKFSPKNYLRHLKEGVIALFGRNLRNYLIPILGLAIFIKLYQGIIRQSTAAYFSFTGETFGYLLAAVSIPATIISFKFDLIKKLFKEKLLLIFNLVVYILAFGLAIFFNNIFLGGLIFLLINVNENLTRPLISVIINQRIDSKHRATILSTLALISQIPYIVLVLFAAQMAEINNLPRLFLLYVFLLILVALYSVLFVKNQAD